MQLHLHMILAWCLPCLVAQDPPATSAEVRGFAVGEVRDAKGRPWTAAQVVLLSRPLGHDANVGEVDRVVVAVDERGRFRASILRGRPYTAWAWGEPVPAGRPASAVCENVFAQQPIVLKQERDLPARTLALDHLDRWPDATFRIRVVDEVANRDVHEVELKDGRCSLPWLVGARAAVELFAVRGNTWCPLSRTELSRNDLAAAAGDLRLEVPECERITCFARSAGDDTPLAGARVYRCLGGAFHLAGTTDAAGTLEIDVAAGSVPGIDTLVEMDDCQMGLFASIEHVAGMRNAKLPAGARPHDLLCRADSCRAFYARFRGFDGSPLAGAEILQLGTAGNRPSQSTGSFGQWIRSRRAGDDGLIALNSTPGWAQPDAHLLLRERDQAALPAAWRPALSPVVFGPLSSATGRGSKEDPWVVDFTQLCPIELSFTGPGGTPAANVEVVLTTLEQGDVAYWPRRGGRGAIADERGRVRLLVPARKRLGLCAIAGMSMIIRAFETTPGDRTSGPATATFELPAPTGIRGRLLDKNGQPAAERVVFASFDPDKAPVKWEYPTDPPSHLAGVRGNALRVLVPDEQFEMRRLVWMIGQQVGTDAGGRFALPLPAVAIPGLQLYQGVRDTLLFGDSRSVFWTGEPIDDLEWALRF
jgi:hypothetical protein